MRAIGRELKVRYVLEGSVQRGGARMRVNVQLIDSESGAHLWAERFDKPLADIFDMQDEIVAHLARQLDTALISAEARRAAQSPRPKLMDLFSGHGVGEQRDISTTWRAQATSSNAHSRLILTTSAR